MLGELGRGAMGIVYEVHDERLDRVIALKTIRKDRFVAAGVPAEEILDRSRREARAAGKLSHPGIVTIYDIGEEGDDLYIAMERVVGEPLRDRMRATPRMGVAEAARIAMRVCEALDYAHAHGVIHRDVKPDNIMCCADGAVKLTDFGIARIDTGPATRTGPPMGTPRYMAPEQWRGDPVDGRADVFAVGIMLYEMLTGCPTFATKSPSELRDLVLREEPPLPTLVNPALPAAIDPIVRRAIAREPADRYANAGELARALAPFARDASATTADGVEKSLAVVRAMAEETTGVEATLPGMEPPAGSMRTIAIALGVVALAIVSVWWAMSPRRSLPMPPVRTAPSGVPATVVRSEATPRVVEATASVVSTVTAVAPTPEIAPAYREARVALAAPEQPDAKKLDVIAALANDASDAATDVLLETTRSTSILVSMAAVKALAGRPCARIVAPLSALLADGEWQRRAWAAKILGVDGCVGARAALAARREGETDARVTKLMDDAIKVLDEKGVRR